jgi:hypothetical protein
MLLCFQFTFQAWSLDTGENLLTLVGHADAVTCISRVSIRTWGQCYDLFLAIFPILGDFRHLVDFRHFVRFSPLGDFRHWAIFAIFR